MVKWTVEQQEAIDESGKNILVAAAAGSGKTAVLVERIIQKLLAKEDPIDIDEILVATFTNAAAEEMRNRIGEALEEAIKEDPTSYHLKKQLSLLQRASISTLHAFCTSVIRQYAYLLDIDPSFRIADEMEIEMTKQEVLEELLEDYYGREDASLTDFFTVVDMFSNDRNDADVAQLVLRLYTFAMQNPWPEEWLDQVAETYNIDESVAETDIAWLNFLKAEAEEQLQSFHKEINRAIAIARESDGPYHYLDALEADLLLIDTALERVTEWDALQQFMSTSTLKRLSTKRVECNEDKKEMIKDIRTQFRNQWNKWKKAWFSRNFQAHLADMRALYPAIKKVTQLVVEFKDRFETVKREQALVDFSDLEHFCLQILIDEASTEETIIPSKVAQQYKKQFKEILVDEYQDINLVQESILSVVSDEDGAGNMFMVGDVKQSIYRFRHAEPTLFIEKYKQFHQDPTAGYRIDLAKNFRSREEVLIGANYIFKQIFDEGLGEIDYDEKAELVYGNLSYDDMPVSEPEIELAVIDRETTEEQANDGENVEDVEKAQLEARFYAKKIKYLLGESGDAPLQVYDKTLERTRSAQYRDVVILSRSLSDAPIIVDELKKQGIPVHAELRSGYFVAIEIQVMINMLKIIDNPHQDIPLASVLRSPIVGLDEEELAQIRLEKEKVPYYESLQEFVKQDNEISSILKHFLAQLKHFRRLAKEGALSELIWEIYQVTGYFDFVGGIPGGRQRQANLRALYDRARGYEATSFRGLFRFLRFIENMQEQDKDLGEARALSEQENVVRIMTIHKSKGLEFPIVLLGGMKKQFNFQDIRSKYILDKDLGFATKFIDPEKRITYPTLYYIALQQDSLRKMLAEEMRVLYVAMTRAKEKLIMVGNVPSFEKEVEKWQAVLAHESWVLPTQLRKDAQSYLDWVGPALIRHEQATHLYENEASSVSVVDELLTDSSKWNIESVPATTLINIDEKEILSSEKMQEIITAWTEVPHVNEENNEKVASRLGFKYQYAEAARTRAKQSVTEIKRRQETMDEYSDTRIVQPFRAPLVSKPNFLQTDHTLSAAEIGTAMHAIMQYIPLTKQWDEADITQWIARFVAEEKITEEEAYVIDVSAIAQFFQTEIAEVMLTHEKVEREVPFTYALDAKEVYPDWQSDTNEQVLIQGVMDCIIHTAEGAIIVDYKTDAMEETEVNNQLLEKLRERYRVQIDLYKRALADSLQTDIKGAYVYFFAKDITIKM